MASEEEQQQEIEALGAIYGDHEFEIINGEYPNIEVKFVLSSVTQVIISKKKYSLYNPVFENHVKIYMKCPT